jgi:hypothetical protein
MRRALIATGGIICLVLGLLQVRNGLLELLPTLAADSGVQAGVEKAKKAADDFAALAKDSYRTGNIPRQSDEAARPLLDAVFEVGILKSKPTLAKEDIGLLGDWLLSANKVGIAYLFAGIGTSDLSKVTNDPKLIESANRNTVVYALEVGRYMDAALVLQATIADVAAQLAANSDSNVKVKSGLEKVRAGLTQTIQGTIESFALDGISDEWRRQRLPALDWIAPKAAKLLRPDQCELLHNSARSVNQTTHDAEIQGELRRFDEALKC